jgi:hypothetical protein
MTSERTTRFENLLHHYNYNYRNNENKRNLIKGEIEGIINALPKSEQELGRNRLYILGDKHYESPLTINDFSSYHGQ